MLENSIRSAPYGIVITAIICVFFSFFGKKYKISANCDKSENCRKSTFSRKCRNPRIPEFRPRGGKFGENSGTKNFEKVRKISYFLAWFWKFYKKVVKNRPENRKNEKKPVFFMIAIASNFEKKSVKIRPESDVFVIFEKNTWKTPISWPLL